MMQLRSSLASTINKELKKKIANWSDDKNDFLMGLLQRYNNAPKYLYPSVIQRTFNLSSHETYELINALWAEGILKRKYRLKINNRYLNTFYNRVNDIPDEIIDDYDGAIHNVSEDEIYLAYQVANDE